MNRMIVHDHDERDHLLQETYSQLRQFVTANRESERLGWLKVPSSTSGVDRIIGHYAIAAPSAAMTRTRAGKCRMSVESIMSCAHPVA